MTSSELLRRPEAVQLIFLTYKNKQFKKCAVVAWRGFLPTTDDEYRLTQVHTEGCMACAWGLWGWLCGV